MTRKQAVQITKALNDIEDFEILQEQILKICNTTEGDFDTFNAQLSLLMDTELDRRKQVLENM